MPDLMRKDVEKLMEEGPPAKKHPERFTRKEQAARAAAVEASEASGSAEAGSVGAARPTGAAAEEESQALLFWPMLKPLGPVACPFCRTTNKFDGGCRQQSTPEILGHVTTLSFQAPVLDACFFQA